jgi:outer membrane protein assembly factor BamB
MGDLVLVGDVEGYVHALATEDGQIRARMRITKAGISDRPQVVDGVAYVYADDGTLAALTAGGALPMAPAREPPASASSPTAEGAAPTTGGLRTGLGSAGDESR